MNVIACVPARGGSKGIVRKNLREVAGKPLVAWSIEAAKQARLVIRVIVSTDDAEIASVARSYGAEIHERSIWASTDEAPIEASLVAVGQQYGPYDWMVTLQPTSPLRPAGLVDACIQRAVELERGVFTAQAMPACWFWQEKTGSEFLDQCAWDRLAKPQQRQAVARKGMLWKHDGSVSVCASHVLNVLRDRMGGQPVPYLTERTVDIDTEADLELADLLLSRSLVTA